MSNLRLVGAVAIKVRPDTSDFRRETQREITEKLGHDGERAKAKAKVEVKLDADKAKREYRTLEQEMNGKTFKLNVGLDHDSVQKAKEQIDRSLDSLKNKIIPFELSKASLMEAKRELAKMDKNAEVKMKIVRDEAGYQSVLDKIKRIREQKGLTKIVKFKTDAASLRKAEKEALEGMARIEANKTVTLSYSKNYAGIQEAIGEIDKRLDKLRELKLKTKLDRNSLEEARAKLVAEMQTAPVTVKFNEDKAGYEKVLSRIKEIQMERIQKEVTFDTDNESLERVAQDMRDKIRSLDPLRSENQMVFGARLSQISIDEVEHKAKQLRDKIEHMKGSMKVELAGSELVAARLRFLGRDRVVNYFARVNASSIAVAEGILKSLGGINTLSSLGKTVEGLFTKFDTLSLKIATVATALGGLANVGVYAGTAMFRVGEGALQSLGLLAAAPAILGAATAGYTIFTAAFNNFFDAFNKDPKIAKEALASLPPLARKTVDSITGLYKGLANPIQERFWSRVGTTLSDAIEKLYPNLKKQLLSSTDAVGDFVAGFGRSMTKLSVSGDLDKMFVGFKGFFQNLSKASEPFFDAWNRFGVQGSSLLPMFGDWIAKMAIRFDDWSKSLGTNGITDMIMHGVHSLQEMWKVGGDVVDIFKGITRAAELAGTGGLAQFQVNLRKTADRLNSEPWQSKAATIFEGARAGASRLNEGFRDLTGTLGNSATWLGNVLDLLGQIGGASLSRLSDIFGGQVYQNGVTVELQGIQTLISDLQPAFIGLGKVIGNMGIVAGSVFSNLAPVINGAMHLLDDVISTLAVNLADVAPKMAATVGGVFRAITPLVMGLTTVLNGMLGILGAIPDSFVTVGVAAAAFFALRALASKFYESLAGKSYFKNLESNWLRQQEAAGKTQEKIRTVNGEVQKFRVPTDRYSAATAAMRDVRSRAGELRGSIKDMHAAARIDGLSPLRASMTTTAGVMTNGLGKAAGGLVSALGGPWGLAMGAAAIGIGLFAQSQQDAKAHVDDLTASIDKQTGKLDESGLQKIAKAWTDLDEAGDKNANFMRGVVNNTKAADDTASKLGLTFADVTRTIAEGGPAYDQLQGKLDTLATAMYGLENGNGNLLNTKENADKAAAAFGFTADELQRMGLHDQDIKHLADNIREEGNAAKLTQAIFKGLGDATGTSTIQAQQMSEAMKTIGDNSTDAASKIGAINKALDLLKGGKLSAREAEVKANSDYQTAINQAKALKEELAGGATLINKSTGLIDTTSAAGLQLQQTMSTAANGIKTAAMAAYQAATDAGKPPAEAMEAAQQVISAHKGDLKGIAEAAGVDVKIIQSEWDGFFGKKWELNAVFSASAIQFEAARKAVEEAGLEWNDKTFSAFLAANPDPAKLSAEEAAAAGRKFANDTYEAQLKAMNPQALQKILEVTGQAENYRKGDYTAVMKALNNTSPGVQAALKGLWSAVNNGGKGWQAAIEAYAKAMAADAELDRVASKKRVANIMAVLTGTDGIPDSIRRPSPFNGAYLPHGVNSAADMWRGKFPAGATSFYANGGIETRRMSENHIAQIARPSSTFRVWAEPETGGEAYIPLAASKRGRSTQILGEVAKQFGLRLTSAQAFAEGGIVTKSRTGGSVAVHIGEYTQNTNDTTDDVARAIMRRVKNEGFYAPMEGF